jgi:hypothetical protein
LSLQTSPDFVTGVEFAVDPPGFWHDPGAEVDVEIVILDSNNTFLVWSGDVADSSEKVSVTMQAPVTLIANFEVPNRPPEILAIPDLMMLEDEIFKRSLGWFAQYIKDPNEPLHVLKYQFQTAAPIEVEVDTAALQLQIKPGKNWNGIAQVIVQVTDNFNESAMDTFLVHIMPVNDPPGAFNLIYPPQDTVITEWFWPMEFRWESASDLDEGDSIIYSFYYSSSPTLSGPGTIAVSFLTDTTILLNVQTDGTFYWGVYAEDQSKTRIRCTDIFQIQLQTDVRDEVRIPLEYDLSQNYPNPFNPRTTIDYELPDHGPVWIGIIDIQGRVVRVLLDEEKQAGSYSIIWNGRNEYGQSVGSGMYMVRMQSGKFIRNRKMLLVR